MDGEKTAAEELAEAQAAFAAAQERLAAAQKRMGQGASAADASRNESPISESPFEGDASANAFANGPFVTDAASGAFSPSAKAQQPVHSDGASGYQAPNYQAGTAANQASAPYVAPNAQQQYAQSFYGSKDHVAAGLLALFLGWLGLHKFYLGYNTQGFILLGVSILGGLFTFSLATWVVWIIAVVEGIIYLSKNQTEFDQIYVQNKREWF